MRYIAAAVLLFAALFDPCVVDAGSRSGKIPVKATINPGTTTLSLTVRGNTPIIVSAADVQGAARGPKLASVSFPTAAAHEVAPRESWDPVSRTLTLNF